MTSHSDQETQTGLSYEDRTLMSSDQVQPRLGRDSEITKGDILRASIHEFAEYGESGARVDRIAIRASVNKSLIYAYFGSKEQLYAAALKEAYVQIRSGEKRLDLDQLAPEDAIRALIKFTMEHFAEAPWFLRLLATENLRRGQTVQYIQNIRELQSPLIDEVSRVLQRGRAAGAFRHDIEAVDLYILIVSFFYFPMSNAHTLPVVFGAKVQSPEWLQKWYDLACDMVLGHLTRTEE